MGPRSPSLARGPTFHVVGNDLAVLDLAAFDFNPVTQRATYGFSGAPTLESQ